MNLRLQTAIAALFIIANTSACGVTSGSRGPADSGSAELEIDLFSAKGFLGGSEYERYHVKDNVVWRECGQVDTSKRHSAPPLEGDEVLRSDPNLVVRERRVERLDPGWENELLERAARFIADMEASQRKPPLPGSVFSLTEPGMFELAVALHGKKQRLITSVDALSDDETMSDSIALRAAHRLFEALRGVGPVICEAETFFGIGRGKL